MKKSLSIFLCLIAVCATVGLAQNKQPKQTTTTVSQFPDSEPFTISRGRSFSASASTAHTQKTDQQPTKNRPAASVQQDFEEALEIIRSNHVNAGKIDYNELTKSSITAMLRSLDPHSNYFDAADYAELLTDQQSEYFGIGATIVNYEKAGELATFVTSTFPDSAASRGGLRFGDKILTVGGENMTGKNSAYVRDKIRGKIGSTVRLSIERAATKRVENIELKRGRIPQPSLPDAYILRPGVGYVDLSNGFNYTTNDELTVALKELKRQGMTSLILDLRDNTGGILEQAVRVAEKFLPEGNVVVSQRGRFPLDNRVWKSFNKSTETMPLVVLVNENTASASEIVAGAMQDYDRALIVGEKTFGKGLVQSIYNLPHRSGLTLTTARYYTPSGRSIQRSYDNVNLYDYFNHKVSLGRTDQKQDQIKAEVRTVTGRKMFGGDGITPDEIVKDQTLSDTQIYLLDPLFFFTRELAAGRVKNFETFRISEPIQYGQRIRPQVLPVSEEMIAAFEDFVRSESAWQNLRDKVKDERAFIKTRLRYSLITAAYGNISANQVLIEDDAQISRAIALLPRASQLALTARKADKNR